MFCALKLPVKDYRGFRAQVFPSPSPSRIPLFPWQWNRSTSLACQYQFYLVMYAIAYGILFVMGHLRIGAAQSSCSSSMPESATLDKAKHLLDAGLLEQADYDKAKAQECCRLQPQQCSARLGDVAHLGAVRVHFLGAFWRARSRPGAKTPCRTMV